MKTNVYIDGFNLYYGCLAGSRYRWLDLSRLCQVMLTRNTINRIRYFTARIEPDPRDPQKHIRQQTYLRALQTIPNLSLHYGKFLSHPIRMPLYPPPATGSRTVQVLKTEEKGSDVNLATYLLLDAFRGDFEVAVIISNDSDLLLPVEVVRTELGLPVGVLNPQKNTSWALKAAATFYRPIQERALRRSLFPHILTDAHGTITKPAPW